jgi:hypothetical protein
MALVIKTHQNNNNKKHINFFWEGLGLINLFWRGTSFFLFFYFLLLNFLFFILGNGGGGGGGTMAPAGPPFPPSLDMHNHNVVHFQPVASQQESSP